MRTMGNIYKYTFILSLVISAVSCKNKPVPSPDNWEIGTSIGFFTSFSQQEFFEFKNQGFNCLELGLKSFITSSNEERDSLFENLKEKLDYSGMKIWSIHLPFDSIYDISVVDREARDFAVNEIIRYITLGKMFGAKKYVIHGSTDIKNESDRSIQIENCIASLKILNEEVKKQGAQFAVECLSRTCLGNTSAELLHIVNSVGNGIGICFDSNHLLHEKPEEFVEKVGALICTVHISDYDGLKSRHWLPGRGNINWANVVSALLKAGYQGPFMFEVKKKSPENTGGAKELAGSWEFIKSEYEKSASK
ncbi:MAG TPA: sugar phosphate isomerase/epimerase [Prolixibacteraceae bacterium]|nr:sugar phosphate isomerase/epimerase [Prolixibacteraceae bacterium]